MFTSQLNPYASIGSLGGSTPFAAQPYAQQAYSPAGAFGIGTQQNVQPLQQIQQLLQIVPQQLQQLQHLQQVQLQHLQQLQQFVQIVPQQLQQIQQLIQFVPQQIQQLQQQLQAQQSFGQSAGLSMSPQFANPFGWSAAQGTQVM
jgi:hypothetical protein